MKVAPRPKKPAGHSLINPSSKRYRWRAHLPLGRHDSGALSLVQKKSSDRSRVWGQLAQLAPQPLHSVHHVVSNLTNLHDKFKKELLVVHSEMVAVMTQCILTWFQAVALCQEQYQVLGRG